MECIDSSSFLSFVLAFFFMIDDLFASLDSPASLCQPFHSVSSTPKYLSSSFSSHLAPSPVAHAARFDPVFVSFSPCADEASRSSSSSPLRQQKILELDPFVAHCFRDSHVRDFFHRVMASVDYSNSGGEHNNSSNAGPCPAHIVLEPDLFHVPSFDFSVRPVVIPRNFV